MSICLKNLSHVVAEQLKEPYPDFTEVQRKTWGEGIAKAAYKAAYGEDSSENATDNVRALREIMDQNRIPAPGVGWAQLYFADFDTSEISKLRPSGSEPPSKKQKVQSKLPSKKQKAPDENLDEDPDEVLEDLEEVSNELLSKAHLDLLQKVPDPDSKAVIRVLFGEIAHLKEEIVHLKATDAPDAPKAPKGQPCGADHTFDFEAPTKEKWHYKTSCANAAPNTLAKQDKKRTVKPGSVGKGISNAQGRGEFGTLLSRRACPGCNLLIQQKKLVSSFEETPEEVYGWIKAVENWACICAMEKKGEPHTLPPKIKDQIRLTAMEAKLRLLGAGD